MDGEVQGKCERCIELERELDPAFLRAMAGEGETPCARCNGTREVPWGLGSNLGRRYTRPCPDCGVETPEAAVEAERAADVASTTLLWLLRRAGDEWGPAGVAMVASDLAQGWTPPGDEA